MGASLLAIALCQSTTMLALKMPSRASSLPQVLYFYRASCQATTASAGETILVFIPRERPELR
ncbi:hypothetical protein C9422_13095 [Pseudomonas sp. B1(2018)]|nr:hypothetical protein C9422_13095 [Pseudomonas sp. B1(2018)]